MEQENQVLEYKCPNCGGFLQFGEDHQRMQCPYCDSRFDIEDVLDHNANLTSEEPEFQWEESQTESWSESEQNQLKSYICPACGGEILTEETTAATFCPYCENPTIMPAQVSGGLKPDGVIPFKKSKADAEAAFLNLCKGKPLLPKFFSQEQRVEKITGMYVPFWLYDCEGDFQGHYKATRIRTWADHNYNYTRTSYYHLVRAADSEFVSIPMDASQKMDNAIMESIEPFDYSQLVDFETAYLSGFLADKYDVDAQASIDRANERIKKSTEDAFRSTVMGYTSVTTVNSNISLQNGKARYALYPVWILNTDWNGQKFTFAINGQTGKIAGDLPMDQGAFWKYLLGVTGAVTALAFAVSYCMWL